MRRSSTEPTCRSGGSPVTTDPIHDCGWGVDPCLDAVAREFGMCPSVVRWIAQDTGAAQSLMDYVGGRGLSHAMRVAIRRDAGPDDRLFVTDCARFTLHAAMMRRLLEYGYEPEKNSRG